MNIFMPMPEWFLMMLSILQLELSWGEFAFEPMIHLFKVRMGWRLQECKKMRDEQAVRAASRSGNRECIWCKMSGMHTHGIKKLKIGIVKPKVNISKQNSRTWQWCSTLGHSPHECIALHRHILQWNVNMVINWPLHRSFSPLMLLWAF